MTLDEFQSQLDVYGLVPGVGEPLDILNGLVSLGRGNYGEAALSLGAAVPVLGWGATGVKIANRADNAADVVVAANRTPVAASGTPTMPSTATGELAVATGVPRVVPEFSGAPLVQGELKASALLNGDLSTPIYRLAGGDAPPMGRSWTTVDPRSFNSVAEFKLAAGILSWNTGEILLIGRLRSFEGAAGRTALPVDGVPLPWVPEIRLNGPAEEMIDLIQIVPPRR